MINNKHSTPPQTSSDDAVLLRRKRGFRRHIAVYFALMLIVIGLNALVIRPDIPWSAFLALGWLAPLSLHTAYVMGLFDRSSR